MRAGSRRSLLESLVLDGDEVSLRIHECTQCRARSLRPALVCGKCGNRSFQQQVSTETAGAVRSFTVVHLAPETVAVPFVSVVVRLDDGLFVRGNLADSGPEPEQITVGERVRMRSSEVTGRPDVVGYEFVPVVTQ